MRGKNKSPGMDGVPYEVWQLLLRGAANVQLARALNLWCAWGDRGQPEHWNDSCVHLIWKGNGLAKDDPSNYRPIALLCTLRKVLERVLHNRLQDWQVKWGHHDLVHWAQHGFRKDRGCNEAHLVLRAARSAAQRAGLKLGVVFLDLRKAYDSVNHYLLMVQLARVGLPPRLLFVIMRLIWDLDMRIQWGSQPGAHEHGSRQPIQAMRGVPQGGILSPLLFNLFINDLVGHPDIHKHGITIAGKMTGCSWFADDGLLLAAAPSWAEVQDKLQQQLDVCKEWAHDHDMIWSPKTKAMLFRRGGPLPSQPLQLGPNMPLEWVRRYCYLGVEITAAVNQDKLVAGKHVIGAAKLVNTHRCLLSTGQGLSIARALTMYKVVIRSKLAYGLACYAACSKLDDVQHQALRTILCTYKRTHRWELQEELCMLTMQRYGGKLACRALLKAMTSMYPWIRAVAMEHWDHRNEQRSLGNLVMTTLQATEHHGGQSLIDQVTDLCADIAARHADRHGLPTNILERRTKLIKKTAKAIKRAQVAAWTTQARQAGWPVTKVASFSRPHWYTREPVQWGNIVFMFRVNRFNPLDKDMSTIACPVCGQPGADNPLHLMIHCNGGQDPELRQELARVRGLLEVKGVGRWLDGARGLQAAMDYGGKSRFNTVKQGRPGLGVYTRLLLDLYHVRKTARERGQALPAAEEEVEDAEVEQVQAAPRRSARLAAATLASAVPVAVSRLDAGPQASQAAAVRIPVAVSALDVQRIGGVRSGQPDLETSVEALESGEHPASQASHDRRRSARLTPRMRS